MWTGSSPGLRNNPENLVHLLSDHIKLVVGKIAPDTTSITRQETEQII